MTKEDHDKATNKATKNKLKMEHHEPHKTKTKQNQKKPTINTKQEW